jgi:O-antigen/teichoic acid export membrane protein
MPRVYGALAAVGGAVWSAGLSLLAVRIYVSELGIEAYGLIGFFVSLQAILLVLDLGLAPAISREVARTSTLGQIEVARILVHTTSRIYWLMGMAIAGAIAAAALPLATGWLDTRRLGSAEITQTIMLMGLVIGCRWPVAVYQNVLIGLGRLGSASLASAAISTAMTAGSIAAVLLIAPSLKVLFLTQAVVALASALAMRSLAWRALGGHHRAPVQWGAVRRIWKFSAGMGGVAITTIALTQLDKALLSRLLPLASFGEYMLAVTIVTGVSVVLGPLFNLIYPQFSALVAAERHDVLRRLYDDWSRAFAVLYLPLVIALGLYASDIVWIWTGHADIGARVAPFVALLCVGWAINGMMFFPYSLQLAYGQSRMPLLINSMLLVLFAPLILFLTAYFGALGGAAAWAGLQILYLFLGTYLTRRGIGIGGLPWLWHSVAVPAAVCAGVGIALQPLISYAPAGSMLKLALIVVSTGVAPLLFLLISPGLRSTFASRLNIPDTVPA